MWSRTFSKIYTGVTKEAIWAYWADVNHWPVWDRELEYCKMEKPFIAGTDFILKPKGGPNIKIILSTVIPNKQFTDYCKFIGATMFDDHVLEETSEGLRITNTITVTGWLSFIWVKLVARNVANAAPHQMDVLVNFARKKHG
ncbi:MAG TPA: polyketide cyclase [Gammaproteobacteria bacterium]|nr:polyketide cyclase [Gammaproteobacteria bacterium]